MPNRFPIIRSAAFVAVACATITSSAVAQKRTSGIDTSNFDRSIRPQDDFFRFVNGGWLKKTQIRSDATGASEAMAARVNRVSFMHAQFGWCAEDCRAGRAVDSA